MRLLLDQLEKIVAVSVVILGRIPLLHRHVVDEPLGHVELARLDFRRLQVLRHVEILGRA